MFNPFRKESTTPEITGMYYRFLCFPDGSGHVELCDENFHNIGYAGSFRNSGEMLEIVHHFVVTMPPTVEYDTYLKFVYRK